MPSTPADPIPIHTLSHEGSPELYQPDQNENLQPAFLCPHLDGAAHCTQFPTDEHGRTEPRQPGFFDYKEGWSEWDGKGKHEEEAFD